LQVTLCDPCLSASSVRYYKKCAIQIHLPLPLPFFLLLLLAGLKEKQDMRWLLLSVCRASIRCPSHCHISKTKQDRPVVTSEHYQEVGIAGSVVAFIQRKTTQSMSFVRQAQLLACRNIHVLPQTLPWEIFRFVCLLQIQIQIKFI